MKIKTVKDIPEIKNKHILLRVDFNVPLTENGEVQDETRIAESLETINFLSDKGAKLIIVSHMGRPKGEVKPELNLSNIAKKLSELLQKEVKKTNDVLSDKVKEEVKNMQEGEILMLENVRFRPEEEKGEENFAKELASIADIFVNDAFAVSHRNHASVSGVAKYLDSYGGFLMEKEIEALSPLVEKECAKPVVMILGGAKIDTKIGLIKKFFDKVDYFLIGGGLANTFLSAAGYNVGESLCQKDKTEVAQEIMLECEKHHEKFILPHDVIVASEISETAETADIPVEDVMGDMKILDIGKWTTEKYCNIISESATVIWNGPLGVCEYTPFQNGTHEVAKCIIKSKVKKSIVGGGDTLDALKRINVPAEGFSHISTGGGACIEFLEGKMLPGIQVLKKS